MTLHRHELGKFVAAREHNVLAADAPALFRGRDPPGAAAPEIGDLGRRVDARAALLRPDQQPRRHLARVDGEIGGREQRGGVIDAEARAQRSAIEKRCVDAGRAAQVSLDLEIAHAEAVAREIERAARLRFELAFGEIACENSRPRGASAATRGSHRACRSCPAIRRAACRFRRRPARCSRRSSPASAAADRRRSCRARLPRAHRRSSRR